MKKIFLLLTAVLSISGSVVWGQTAKSMSILKNQSLVVVLKDEEPGKLKKLAKKPSELADYKAFILDYNTQIQELAQQLWHFSPAVEFKYESEMPALLKDKSFEHGVLQHDNFVAVERTGGAARGGVIYSSSMQTAFSLGVISNGNRSSLAQVPIAPGVVHTSDIIFCLKGLQYQLQLLASGKTGKEVMADMAQNAKRLRIKTLLLDDAEINSKLTAADIKQVYPFPYQIVPRSTIEAAVKEGDARYACVRMLPIASSSIEQVIMDTSDGAILVMTSGGGWTLKGGSVVDKSNLKAFAQAASGK